MKRDGPFFVLVSRLGIPGREVWELEHVDDDRVAAQVWADGINRAITVVDHGDVIHRRLTVALVVSREEAIEQVGLDQWLGVEHTYCQMIEAAKRHAA